MRHPKLLLGIFAAFVACNGGSDDAPAVDASGTDGSSGADSTGTSVAGDSTSAGPGSTSSPDATGSSSDESGSSSESSSDSTGEPPLERELVGTWTSTDCEVIPGDAPTYFTRTFELAETAWTLDFSTFGDPACTPESRLFRVEIAGDYELGDASAVVRGAVEAFFGFEIRRITPVQQAAADFMNDSALCGVTRWAVDQTVDVHESGCPGLGIQPAVDCAGEYDLVALMDDALYFGTRPADGNLCSVDRRPTELGAPLERVR